MIYPLATGDQVQYRPPSGSTLHWMHPKDFLSRCPPLKLYDDPRESDYIKSLVEHIEHQMPLDGLELHPVELNGSGHEGRHRATAALIAGCSLVPVFIIEKMEDWKEEECWDACKGEKCSLRKSYPECLIKGGK
jgi:hypothetical protein